MGYAFISYSSKNQEKADRIRQLFIESGVEVWMAPYDIPAGVKYAQAITRAIRECSCSVLLLSNDAQNSDAVDSEVELSTYTFKKPIVIIRLEEVELNDSFFYYLHNRHMIDLRVFEPSDPAFQNVLSSVTGYAGRKEPAPASAPAPRPAPASAPAPRPAPASAPAPQPEPPAPAADTGFDRKAFEKAAGEFSYSAGLKEALKENFEWALPLMQNSYRQGNVLACIRLGLMYHYGNGVAIDKEKAFGFFKEAAEKGNPLAVAWLAEYYRMGHLEPKDKEKAKETLRGCLPALEEMAACGDGEAQYYLGFEYIYGATLGVKDPEKGLAYLKQAYETGVISSGVTLAECYIKGIGCEADPAAGVALLQECAKTSNCKAHYHLGKLYYYGEHLEKDLAKAYELFLFGGERGHKFSMSYLGDCFYYGEGVEKDLTKAVEWFRKGQEAGSSYCARRLGQMYLHGDGVEKNAESAFRCFLTAEEKGDTRAKYHLCHFYFEDGPHKDYEKGRACLLAAGEDGIKEAQKKLAQYYNAGTYGFEKNTERGLYWTLKAQEKE